MPMARASHGGEVEIPESPLPALIEEIAAAADVPSYIDQNWTRILRIIKESTLAARASAAEDIQERFIGPDRLDNPHLPNRLHWQKIYYGLLATTPPNYSAWLLWGLNNMANLHWKDDLVQGSPDARIRAP
jgi:hypothetical protein